MNREAELLKSFEDYCEEIDQLYLDRFRSICQELRPNEETLNESKRPQRKAAKAATSLIHRTFNCQEETNESTFLSGLKKDEFESTLKSKNPEQRKKNMDSVLCLDIIPEENLNVSNEGLKKFETQTKKLATIENKPAAIATATYSLKSKNKRVKEEKEEEKEAVVTSATLPVNTDAGHVLTRAMRRKLMFDSVEGSSTKAAARTDNKLVDAAEKREEFLRNRREEIKQRNDAKAKKCCESRQKMIAEKQEVIERKKKPEAVAKAVEKTAAANEFRFLQPKTPINLGKKTTKPAKSKKEVTVPVSASISSTKTPVTVAVTKTVSPKKTPATLLTPTAISPTPPPPPPAQPQHSHPPSPVKKSTASAKKPSSTKKEIIVTSGSVTDAAVTTAPTVPVQPPVESDKVRATDDVLVDELVSLDINLCISTCEDTFDATYARQVAPWVRRRSFLPPPTDTSLIYKMFSMRPVTLNVSDLFSGLDVNRDSTLWQDDSCLV